MDYLDILVKLRKINRSINLENKRIEKQFGISLPQLLILKYLFEQKGEVTSASKIKSFINLNASTVSGIIHRLEGKGMITRTPDQKDKRTIIINLTAKGNTLIEETSNGLGRRLKEKVKILNPEEIEALLRNLTMLSKLLE